jgi:hypothetical protein
MTTDTSARIRAIAEQLEVLSKELRNNRDPEGRRALLRNFRVLLAEADKVIAEQTTNESGVLRHGHNVNANSNDHRRTLPRT